MFLLMPPVLLAHRRLMMRNLVMMRIFLVSQLILFSAWTSSIEHKSYLLDTEDGWDVLVPEETEDKAMRTKYINEDYIFNCLC